MGNSQYQVDTHGAPYQTKFFGGRKRTLRKRTRRGGQMYQEPWTLAGGRKRTLRKRTRRGGQMHPERAIMTTTTL